MLGTWLDKGHELAGPLFAMCPQCNINLRIIDRSRDGYDGEIGDGIDEGDAGMSAVWSCGVCGRTKGKLIASFGYQYEANENDERLHDFFDAFILSHICPDSGEPVVITAFECA